MQLAKKLFKMLFLTDTYSLLGMVISGNAILKMDPWLKLSSITCKQYKPKLNLKSFVRLLLITMPGVGTHINYTILWFRSPAERSRSAVNTKMHDQSKYQCITHTPVNPVQSLPTHKQLQ